MITGKQILIVWSLAVILITYALFCSYNPNQKTDGKSTLIEKKMVKIEKKRVKIDTACCGWERVIIAYGLNISSKHYGDSVE